MKQLHQTNKSFSPEKAQNAQEKKNRFLPNLLRLL